MSKINTSDPIHAMAQLNDLYVQLDNCIIKNPSLVLSNSKLAFFPNNHQELKQKLCEMLANNYISQLEKAHSLNYRLSLEELNNIVKNQKISTLQNLVNSTSKDGRNRQPAPKSSYNSATFNSCYEFDRYETI